MFQFLVKKFITDYMNTDDPAVRRSYATVSSIYGIFLNILLFAGKYIAGTVSGSTAIIADAFNNLSDAGSSVISFIGFRLAGKKPDKDHPFGHGRMEYIAGFIISSVIVVVGIELCIESIKKIVDPQPIIPGLLSAAIMIAAILVKLYMFLYNRSVGKKISSAALIATATDSLTDCLATLAALFSMGLVYFFGINIDGWAGALVSLFVIYAGITSAKDTLSPLLGQAPDRELVEGIEQIVMSHPEVKGIHDLIINDYGPGRLIISLHAEVDGKENIFTIHDAIDLAERELSERYNCIATIHMDPIESDDSEIQQMKHQVLEAIKPFYPDVTIHDFRLVPGNTHSNLIFDAVLPGDCTDSDETAQKKISEAVSSINENYFAVVHIDRSFV